MISIRVKYRPSNVANKEGVIYYQLIQHRKCRQITTCYKLFATEWCHERSIVDVHHAAYHRREYLHLVERHIVTDMASIQRTVQESNDVDKVISTYSQGCAHRTLFHFASHVIDNLKDEGRAKTALSYKGVLRSFAVFRQEKDLTLDEITPHLIKRYENFLKERLVCNNTISFYMRILRAIYNRAVRDGLTNQCYPFKGVYVGIDKTKKRAVDEAIISRLKNLNLSDFPGLEFARDLFLFSFYARGMAFVDIAHLTKTNIHGDYIVYQRHKTGQELFIRIESCLKEIIIKYSDEAFDCRCLLPVLEKKNNYESALRLQNMRLKRISDLMELTIPLSSYVARHSWATLAKRRGISIQIISESMGHNNEKTTQIYLSSLDRSVIDQANARLLSGL